MGRKNSPGCNCCAGAPPATTSVIVAGLCSAGPGGGALVGLPGATVTLAGGGYSATATTDATGTAVLSPRPGPGTYTLTVTSNDARVNNATTVITATTAPAMLTASLTPVACYVCQQGSSFGSDAGGCHGPYPIELVLTTPGGAGTVTLTAVDSFGRTAGPADPAAAWQGTDGAANRFGLQIFQGTDGAGHVASLAIVEAIGADGINSGVGSGLTAGGCGPPLAMSFSITPGSNWTGSTGPFTIAEAASPCPPSSTSATIHVTGCHGLGLAGALVTASLAGQANVAGTTDSSGNVTLTFPVGGTWSLAATKPRFGAGSGAVTPPAGATIALTPAAGYLCIDGCADPLPATLHLTHARTGSGSPVALTYDATNRWWAGCAALTGISGTIPTRPGLPCSAAAVTTQVQFYFDPITAGNDPGVLTAYCPCCPDGLDCPGGGNSCPRPLPGGWSSETGSTATATTETCPQGPSFLWSGTLTLPAVGSCIGTIFSSGATSITE